MNRTDTAQLLAVAALAVCTVTILVVLVALLAAISDEPTPPAGQRFDWVICIDGIEHGHISDSEIRLIPTGETC